MDSVVHIDVRGRHSLHFRVFPLVPMGVGCLLGSHLRVFGRAWKQLSICRTPTDSSARTGRLLTHALAILATTSVPSFGCRIVFVVALILRIAVLEGS